MPGRRTQAEISAARPGPGADLGSVLEAFDRASRRVGVVERHLTVGGFRVKLRAAGRALLDELWPALAHLSGGGANGGPDLAPDLTIVLWDSASTGVELPEIGWMSDPDDDPRTIRVARGSGLRMAYRASERELVGLDQAKSLAVMWAPGPAEITVHVRGAPFIVIWHWWMRARGVHPVHAGAVGDAQGGVLLVGRGGSGKSTTSVLCLLDGMSYASDDYVMIRAGSVPTAFSLYSTAKLDPKHAATIPELAPALRPGAATDEKVLAFMHAFRPERVIERFPIRAVISPRVVGGSRTTLRPIRPAEALAALGPSTVLQLPIPDPSAFAAAAEVVRRVPSFRLELGSDRSSIAPAVREAIASV
jgi:hypothetical protein